MATIVTRAGKGSALTFVEGDANFTNLNTAKIELTSLSVGSPASASGSGSIAYNNTTGVFTYTPPEIPAAGIGNVVEDTTPQLGGNLDVDDYKITTTSSTVALTIEGYQDVTYGYDIETNSETGIPPVIAVNGQIHLADSTGIGYGAVTTQTGVALFLGVEGVDLTKPNITLDTTGSIVMQASGTTPSFEIISDGDLMLQGLIYPAADGTAGQFITTDGSGALGFTSTLEGAGLVDYREAPYALTYASTITPNAANGNVQIVTLTGNVTMNALGSPVSGQSLTLIVKQDATGSRTLTSSMKFAGGSKTLTTAANSIDIITVFYDGTNYWASLGKDFK
jgi:hypothetical protein